MDLRGPEPAKEQYLEGSWRPQHAEAGDVETQARQRIQSCFEALSIAKRGKDSPPPGPRQGCRRRLVRTGEPPALTEIGPLPSGPSCGPWFTGRWFKGQ